MEDIDDKAALAIAQSLRRDEALVALEVHGGSSCSNTSLLLLTLIIVSAFNVNLPRDALK